VSEATDPIFARVAGRYDLINRLLSAGRDQAWRASATRWLPRGRVIDLGSGTGAVAPLLQGQEVIAVDPVLPMLQMSPIKWRVGGVGEALPFRDGSIDGVFSAYVLRNLTSVDRTLDEVHRVLRIGGVMAVVDLGRPANRIARSVHRVGTAATLPMAGLLAKAPGDYWYLHQSLDKLPSPEELLSKSPLRLKRVWRMGLFGFVYGALLTKESQ
jgi:demethylmenaquinone methyltransferase/2-methoxy-6-polyprenyl-1,4-benzoquinol methylase